MKQNKIQYVFIGLFLICISCNQKSDDFQNSTFNNLKNSQLGTLSISKYDDETIKESAYFLHNEKHGEYKYWHSNGNLAVESNYNQGIEHGLRKEYFVNGNLQMVKQFDRGNVIANKLYNIDGDVMTNYVIKDGRKYGLVYSSECIGGLMSKRLTKEK